MNVSILGVGLIGGSIGLAARRAGEHVVGYDCDPEALSTALQVGAIDEQVSDVTLAVADAEVVFVATPVGTLPEMIAAALARARDDCVVTDVGSTKQSVAAAGVDRRFVGGHPLAGKERAGVRHASVQLFDGEVWYLTTSPDTDSDLYERLRDLLTRLGAQPTMIEPETHDYVMACVSHLPHILANVLVGKAIAATSGTAKGKGQVPATGPSFRHATRVAGANSAIWTDIYLANREALIGAIDETERRLQEARELLLAGDAEAITAWNERARAEHDELLGGSSAQEPLYELAVNLPDRPGAIGELTLALGKAGINIADFTVFPSSADGSGMASLSVRGTDAVQRAEELIEDLGFKVAQG